MITYTYDTANYSGGSATQYRLTQMRSNIGYEINITYQGTGVNYPLWRAPSVIKLVRTANPTVALSQLTYAAGGGSATDLLGRTYTCGCSSAGGPVETTNASFTLPGESTPTEVLSGTGYVTNTVTRDGVPWSYTYLNYRTLSSPEGYGYDKVTVTGPAGNNQVYNIQAGIDERPNQIASSVDSIGRTTSYLFDGNGRLTKLTLPEGNYTQVGYDNWGNVTSKLSQPKSGSGLTGVSESATYDTTGCSQTTPGVKCYRMLSYTDALSRTTTYTYDAAGRMTSEIAPADSSGVQRAKYLAYGTSYTTPLKFASAHSARPAGRAANSRRSTPISAALLFL